jgi:hypothetical protein
MSAYKSEKWWENVPSSPHAKGWLDAGFEVREVNLKEGYVVFHKVKQVPVKKRSSADEIKKPFTPVHVRIPKPKTPSKTKVSRLYARIKNIERQRTGLPKFRGISNRCRSLRRNCTGPTRNMIETRKDSLQNA